MAVSIYAVYGFADFIFYVTYFLPHVAQRSLK